MQRVVVLANRKIQPCMKTHLSHVLPHLNRVLRLRRLDTFLGQLVERFLTVGLELGQRPFVSDVGAPVHDAVERSAVVPLATGDFELLGDTFDNLLVLSGHPGATQERDESGFFQVTTMEQPNDPTFVALATDPVKAVPDRTSTFTTDDRSPQMLSRGDFFLGIEGVRDFGQRLFEQTAKLRALVKFESGVDGFDRICCENHRSGTAGIEPANPHAFRRLQNTNSAAMPLHQSSAWA